ncbi:uncharacterized protein [Clytia hemisphaerica]|uniref:Serine incorporator n=1 Tax=Clytia hemisphaerica TaxID=252671 RepID=A0A7M5VEC4_9CNID
MGAVLQTAGVAELAAELTCCACSSICGLAARDSATRAKFRYCSFLLLATVTCVIAMIPGLRAKMDKIPNLCNKVVSSDTCDKFVGFGAVYRIIFAMTAFHFILALLMIRVKKVTSFRARLNNGLWMFKMGLIFGLTFATFYIPKRIGIFRIWMYLSLTGGFMFIMFQIILVIDFGNSWSLTWAEKLETGQTKLWYVAMAIVTLLIFAVCFVALIAFYIYFTHPANVMKCNANFFYISFMGMQCVLAVAVSVTPSVQNHLPGAGLLQSSVVILYALYLTWNTLSSEPDSSCNPLGNIILEYDSYTGVSGGAIFGCLLTLVLLIFACTVRTTTSHLGKYGLALAESETYAMATLYEDTKKTDDETRTRDYEFSLVDYVGYNYSFFHIIMSLASMHILMVLTNWHSPEENSSMKTLVKNWPSVWVQMASSFACILLYIWFLVTPLVKSVWGPTFGVSFNETIMYEKSIKGNLLAFSNKKKRKSKDSTIIEQPLPRDSFQPMTSKIDKKEPIISKYSTSRDFNLPITNKNRQFEPNGPTMFQHSTPRDYEQPIKSATRNSFVTQKTGQKHIAENLKIKQDLSRSFAPTQTLPIRNKAITETQRYLPKQSLRTIYGQDSGTEPKLKDVLDDKMSTVSTSTRRENVYDYKSRYKRRSKRLSQLREHSQNTSMESVNSWINPKYRDKYKPLRYRIDSDYIPEESEQTSPIESSSYNFLRATATTSKDSRRRPSQPTSTATKRSSQPSSLTIRIKKSSHKSSYSTIYDNNIDNDVSEEMFKFRKKKKIIRRANARYRAKQDSQRSTVMYPPLKTINNISQSQSNIIPKNDTRHHKSSDKKPLKRESSVYRTKLEESFVNNEPLFDKNLLNTHNDAINKQSMQKITLLTREELEESKIEDSLQKSTNQRPTIEQTSNQVALIQKLTNKYESRDISLVPSVFHRKPQSTETASEILSLQWKILKTQAKIVKVQERIYNLQQLDNDHCS